MSYTLVENICYIVMFIALVGAVLCYIIAAVLLIRNK
jgi:hypothetical protein